MTWDDIVDMDCDGSRDTHQPPAKSDASTYGMVPSLSSSSIASSTSSSTIELDREPELSRSLGSNASFDLRTPLKLTQPSTRKVDDAASIKASFDSFSLMYRHPHQMPVKRGPSPDKAGADVEAPSPTSRSDPRRGIEHDQNVSPTKVLTSSPVSLTERSSPFSKSNPNRPKLSLPLPSASLFSRPNVPQTPGGSIFHGARDGAATGAPVSPFIPPTPLVATAPTHGGFFDSSSDELNASPSPRPLQRQSLPMAVSTPRQKVTRSPLERHGSIGMSPLSQEFASVSVRGKTRSNENAGTSNKEQSTSTLLTPPYSPLVFGKGLQQDDSVAGQRRSSRSSSSSSSGGSGKKRAKDAIFRGANAEMARSFSASRIKSSRKQAPKPFNLSKPAILDRQGAGSATNSGLQQQPLSAPAMKISFSEQHPAKAALDDQAVNTMPETMSVPLPSPSLLSPHAVPMPKAPAMEKSLSAPPQTVSARHLANYKLHPIFDQSYTIRDELGSGGFGFVVSATRKHDGLAVAVKFIFKDKVPAHGWVRDPKLGVIPMEAFVLKVVDHPGVVKFIDLFDDKQFFYLVMELHGTPWRQPNAPEPEPKVAAHPGPSAMQRRTSCDLFECIEQHSRLEEEQARWVFAQVVETVWHLDRVGICHRDIKDENCVVDADFNVKLIDFGSAVITDVRKPTPYFNRFFGTMTFASSEILQGKPYRAPQAEVWSLGVLLSILLSGECPFADPSAAIKGRISKPKGAWSQDALALLLMCLEVDPDRRASISEIRDHPWVQHAWTLRRQKT